VATAEYAQTHQPDRTAGELVPEQIKGELRIPRLRLWRRVLRTAAVRLAWIALNFWTNSLAPFRLSPGLL